MRIWTLALVVGLSGLVAGCGEEKKEPKAPAGADLKPLNAPAAPGGAAPAKKGAPGGAPSTQ